MWPNHLSRPRAGKTEQARQNEKAAGKTLVQEYQQNCSDRSSKYFKRKKKTKNGGSPKTNTIGDCNSGESTAEEHAVPEPPLPSGTVRADRYRSVMDLSATDDLESNCQRLQFSLYATKRKNQLLWSEAELLRQERKDLQDQHDKENEKNAHVQEALKEELEVHKIAIEMLISNEGDIKSTLSHMPHVAESEMEREGHTSHLRASQQRMLELETALSAVTTKQNKTEKKNQQLTEDLTNLKVHFLEKIRSYNKLARENTEFQERVEVLSTQTANMKRRINQFQHALLERAAMKRQLDNLKSLVTTLKWERDKLAEDLRVEKSTWAEKVQQLSEKINQMTEEREQKLCQVVELENNLSELRKQLAEQQPPAEPSQVVQQLQAQACQLQKELKNLEEQLNNQLQENQRLALQNMEQQERLRKLDEDHHNILETSSCTHARNKDLKYKLAQLQAACHQLTGEKGELTRVLYLEQQEKLEQQQKIEEWKEVAETKSQMAQNLQELHDQFLAQLQELRATCDQHVASNQELTLEKEALQQHVLKQTVLLEQLKKEQVQSKLKDQMVTQNLQDTLKCLETTRQQKEKLRAQLSLLAYSGEGEEGVSNKEKGEEATPPDITYPEDDDNPQAIGDFYLNALAAAESIKLRLNKQLQEQQARCSCLDNLASQFQTKIKCQALFPKSWGRGVSWNRKKDTQEHKKLKVCFIHDQPDKIDFQSQLEELQHQSNQLIERISTIEESIVLSKEQMEVLDELYREKDEYVDQLSQEKREKKEELQELLMRLAGESTDCRSKMPVETKSLAAETTSEYSGPEKTGPEKTSPEEKKEFEEVSLEDDIEPAQVEAEMPGPLEAPTTGHIVPLLPNVQNDQALSGSGNEHSASFFFKLRQMVNMK
ncbi:golgin subfamily A member 2-like [Thomomys bottae]